jgi:hypothetical protein
MRQTFSPSPQVLKVEQMPMYIVVTGVKSDVEVLWGGFYVCMHACVCICVCDPDFLSQTLISYFECYCFKISYSFCAHSFM